MQQEEMESWLAELGTQSRLPVWSFSYNRAGQVPGLDAPFLRETNRWANREDIHVVVRESQVGRYQEAFPWISFWPVPDAGDCVGRSRQAALDFANTMGHDEIVLVDDDLTNTSFLYQGYVKSGKNTGLPCSRRSGRHHPMPEGRVVSEYVVAGISEVGRTVMASHPEAVLGGGVKQHGAIGDPLHRTMYRLNGGVTPKQLMVAAPARLADAGVRLDVDLFGRHGDDIGLVAEILTAGLACWAMPTFTYDVWPEDQNINKSVVRNPETAHELHAEEWAALQKYPIKDHLRVKTSLLDGSFEWADINWQSWAKVSTVQPVVHLWPQDACRELI